MACPLNHCHSLSVSTKCCNRYETPSPVRIPKVRRTCPLLETQKGTYHLSSNSQNVSAELGLSRRGMNRRVTWFGSTAHCKALLEITISVTIVEGLRSTSFNKTKKQSIHENKSKNLFDLNSAFPFDSGIHTHSQLCFVLNIWFKAYGTRIL